MRILNCEKRISGLQIKVEITESRFSLCMTFSSFVNENKSHDSVPVVDYILIFTPDRSSSLRTLGAGSISVYLLSLTPYLLLLPFVKRFGVFVRSVSLLHNCSFPEDIPDGTCFPVDKSTRLLTHGALYRSRSCCHPFDTEKDSRPSELFVLSQCRLGKSFTKL